MRQITGTILVVTGSPERSNSIKGAFDKNFDVRALCPPKGLPGLIASLDSSFKTCVVGIVITGDAFSKEVNDSKSVPHFNVIKSLRGILSGNRSSTKIIAVQCGPNDGNTPAEKLVEVGADGVYVKDVLKSVEFAQYSTRVINGGGPKIFKGERATKTHPEDGIPDEDGADDNFGDTGLEESGNGKPHATKNGVGIVIKKDGVTVHKISDRSPTPKKHKQYNVAESTTSPNGNTISNPPGVTRHLLSDHKNYKTGKENPPPRNDGLGNFHWPVAPASEKVGTPGEKKSSEETGDDKIANFLDVVLPQANKDSNISPSESKSNDSDSPVTKQPKGKEDNLENIFGDPQTVLLLAIADGLEATANSLRRRLAAAPKPKAPEEVTPPHQSQVIPVVEKATEQTGGGVIEITPGSSSRRSQVKFNGYDFELTNGQAVFMKFLVENRGTVSHEEIMKKFDLQNKPTSYNKIILFKNALNSIDEELGKLVKISYEKGVSFNLKQ